MKYYIVLCGMGLIFIIYEIAMYGITSYILNRSPSFKNDFLWCFALAIPFALAEVLWLRAWRIAEEANISVWSTDILYIVSAIVGSSIAMMMFFKETPTLAQVFGLLLVLIGGLIAVWK
jgi:drug/metabolite transporter (DMT)-like permease